MAGTSEERVSSLLERIFQEAQPDPEGLPWLGGTRVYLQKADDDVNLVIHSGIKVNASVSLRGVLIRALELFPDDADAVKAMEDAIAYMQTEITTLVGNVICDLIVRSINLQGGEILILSSAPETIKNPLKTFLGTGYSSIEKKQLRADSQWGGNRKTKRDWLSDETRRQYAQLVNARRPLVERIKFVYSDCHGADTWIEDLKRDATFQVLSLSHPVSDKILYWAIKQVASQKMTPRYIACVMACRELVLSEPSVDTLYKYYKAGTKLLQHSRSGSINK